MILYQMSDGDIMWTYSRCFSYSLRLSFTNVKGSKDTDIGNDCVRDFVSRGTYSTGTCIRSAFINSVNVIKCS